MDSSSEIGRLESRNHSSIPLTPVVDSQEKGRGSSTTRLEFKPENEDEDETANHLTGLKLYLVIAGLCISVLLVALVRRPTMTISVHPLNTACRTKQYWQRQANNSSHTLFVRTDIKKAIPTITTDFNSLKDVGWYGSAFLITM